MGDDATSAPGDRKKWGVYPVPMGDLNGDWTAIGTLALAVVTAALAIATGWLGWKTSNMASATRQMADATTQLVNIENERRAEEGLANLIIARRETKDASQGMRSLAWFPAICVVVQNTGRGEATNISVAYRNGDRGGVFDRDRLMGRDLFSFTEHEFNPPLPEDLPVSGDSFMKIGWTDAGGSHSSPLYQWRAGSLGAPILAGDATEASTP